MLARSYLILSPYGPTDVGAAEITQRQSIPLVWAFAISSRSTRFIQEGSHYYFETPVGDALAMLDRGLASWNYNSYFRDVLAPVGIFRAWLANYSSETKLYVNISELLRRSPDPTRDVAELGRLREKVEVAFGEIEEKHFTIFVQELRKLSYPLVTVPITGDRKVDVEILSFEMRDTGSVEAEMALQMIGVDRSGILLDKATESIRLRKADPRHNEADLVAPAGSTGDGSQAFTLFTSNMDEARRLLVDELGCSMLRDSHNRLVLNAHGREFMLVKIEDAGAQRANVVASE